jgi:alcohol dehydrogenase (cytochrome c)
LFAIAAIGGMLQAQDITNKDLLAGLSNSSAWLTYSGDYSGQRHSPLEQLTPSNVGQLAAQWTFQTGVLGKFEATPIVVDGVVYVTGPNNRAWAIDARTGRQIWAYERVLPKDFRACCGPVNRGFAVYRDRLYMGTLDAHLIALDRKSGKVLWDVEITDYTQGYAAPAAPLVVKDKLIVGIAGGEFAIRGFIDAYNPETGARVWRLWTVPAPGEPGSETWSGESWKKGGGPTWLTGTYDPDLNLVYWGTGNPSPSHYGEDRKGDNLYTASLIAFDPDTGSLKWHYQFTPHDLWDWDANQIPVLADLTINGRPRKVVMAANRNGFFYVLDRADGQFLYAKPYVERLTWAKEIDSNGRPVFLPNQIPTKEGTKTCPDALGATNFMSPAFDPVARLFFVSSRETCRTFVGEPPPADYKMGDRTLGGRARPPTPEDRGWGALRAIDPLTGERKWEVRHETPPWAGVLSTASGLVFSGNSEGVFFVVNARDGKELWRYQTGGPIYAAPTTYMIDRRQYVTIPAGQNLTSFALPSSVVERSP